MRMRVDAALPGLLALALLSGCQPAPGANATSATTQPAAAKIDSPDQSAADAPSGRLTEESWDAYSMRDPASGRSARVGYVHTQISSVVEGGRQLIKTRSLLHLSMHRLGQAVKQEMTVTSWDDPEGGLVRFESRLAGGPGEVVSVGAVRDGALGIDTRTLGRTQSQKIAWQAGWGGLFAVEQSLRQSPLRPGQTRTIKSLQPILNLLAETRLEALGEETVDLPEGAARLLKIRSVVDLGAQSVESFLWINDSGQTLKSIVPSLGQEAVRTTKADALEDKSGGAQYDLLVASTVPLQGSFPRPRETARVVYRAHVKSGQISGLFSQCLSQRVKPVDERTAEITVLAIRPGQPLESAGGPPPVAADSAPNNFVQSDDSQIVALASRATSGESDPWKVACALEKFVDGAVHNKNFSTAFATAAEVARSLEGDCTEHAVLLAALCRARQIPARVAFGLVYFPPEKGFAYHMWNEVWINDRWIPLDGTLGQGGIGADHVKLGDSNLSGGSPLADLLNVVQVFGRLELEVLAAE